MLKFYLIFTKTLASVILKTKTIFLNADEHEYYFFSVKIHWSWFKYRDLRNTNAENGVNLWSIP